MSEEAESDPPGLYDSARPIVEVMEVIEEDTRLCQYSGCLYREQAVRVCHHPLCAEENKRLPLLLCRQCDQDIHRQPQYSGHLVLDACKKTNSALSSSRRSRSPAESDSEHEFERLNSEDCVDGRQRFLKSPTRERNGSRSPPSELQTKLKRKKAVKKRSFSKNDHRHHTMDDSLVAALAQIAHPEGGGGEGEEGFPGDEGQAGGEGAEGSPGQRHRHSSLTSFQHHHPGPDGSSDSQPFDPGVGGAVLAAAASSQRAPIRRQSRVPVQENFFTIKICYSDAVPDDPEDHEVLASAPNISLREALQPSLERRGIDVSAINVFIDKSKTPLPLSSDTCFLAGNTLEIKEKDDLGLEMVTQGSKHRAGSASKATGHGNRNSKSAGGSLRGRRGTNLSVDDSCSLPSTSPQGTLTFSEGGKKPKGQKLSVVSLFNNSGSVKEREKQDHLQEILNDYSTNGLPPVPTLLSIGRPTFDPTVFEMESDWRSVVNNDFVQASTKRQLDQQEAVWELLHTELSYISQIRVITDVFQNCLLNIQEKGLLSEIELEKLFSSIDKILDANCRLWQECFSKVLEETRHTRKPLNPSILKQAFTLEFESLVEPYTRYCKEHKQCVEYMKKSNSEIDLFRIFVAWAEAQKQCNRLKLTDLLVKPMQRLTKYSLLLQAILRKTEDDRQRRDLLEMIASVDKYVTSINNSMQQQHDLERLEAITMKIEQYDAVDAPTEECLKIIQEYNGNFNLLAPMSGFHSAQTRSLLMHSNLRMKDFRERVDVECFLFTDLMLICKSTKRCDKFKIIKPPMRLDQIVVSELKDKGSFLLIYLNEYHIPISALTLNGDQSAVRSWLEKIKDAQDDYKQKMMEDHQQHLNASSITEQVDYTPAQPLHSRLTLPRTDSCESAEGQFLPNIAPAKLTTTAATPSPEKPQHSFRGHGVPLERSGSYTEMPPPSGISRILHHNRHASSSPEFSPTLDRRHRPVKACHSVPNMSAELQVADCDDDDYDDEHESSSLVTSGLSMKELSVRAAADGSPFSSMSNMAEPGPVENDRTARLQQGKPGGQRRSSRNEKRYYTADAIQELRQPANKDSSIHKRLSWQNADHVEEKLGKRVLSSESVTSIPSSSGVSSTASLHFQPDSDISEEGEINIQRSGSSQTLLADGSGVPNNLGTDFVGNSPRAKSMPDFVTLFNSLKTGEQEDGISSVDLPPGIVGGMVIKHQNLTPSQMRQMKELLLTSQNASVV